MRPRHLVLALLFLLTIGLARADVSLSTTPVSSAIDWNGTAMYKVTVVNSGISDIFRLRPATFEWGTVRFDDYALYVAGTATTNVLVQPPRDILMGSYAVEIMALSNSNASIRGSGLLMLTILSELPHVEPSWSISSTIEPGKTNVTLILRNAGSTDVSGITAKLTSPLLKTPVEFNVGNMARGEAKLVWNTILDIPLNTLAKDYDFTLTVFKDGDYVMDYVHKVNVLEKESVNVTVLKEPKFLGKKYTVTIENVGNTLADNYYKITVPSWQRFFIEGKVRPVISVDDDTAEAAWPYSLPLGASTTLIYTISFLPLLAILISALLLLYAVFWYFGQGLSISKELMHAERALKVKLHIKNNSTRPQRNIIVEDSIPTPLTLSREFATLHPTAIKKSDGAVKVLWKFDVIWPHEEKILTYNMKSSLAISGMVMLPAAKIRKKGDIGETPKVFLSNRVAVKGRIRATGAEETYK
jgi:hypothetical protein